MSVTDDKAFMYGDMKLLEINIRKYIKNIMKQITVLLSIIAALSGCASSNTGISDFNTGNKDDKSQAQEEQALVPVAGFAELPMDLGEADWLVTGRSSLYYGVIKWNKESELLETMVYRWREGDKAPALIAEGTENNEVRFAFADEEENLYLFGYVTENSIIKYYLEKYSEDGLFLWQWELGDELSVLEGTQIKGGVADGEGCICLYDHFGKLYLFDAQGKFTGSLDEIPGKNTDNGLIRTEDGHVYEYFFNSDPATGSETLSYYLIDMEEAARGRKLTFVPEGKAVLHSVWGGTGDSVLITDAGTLWEVEPGGGNGKAVVDWSGEYINIDGREVLAVNIPEAGKLQVYMYDPLRGVSEYAAIGWKPESTLVKKETVTVGVNGIMENDSLSYFVKSFNRYNSRWHVKLTESITYDYDTYLNDFTLDMLNGDIPDIVDTQLVPVEFVKGGDGFERLDTYFENSSKVSQEDLIGSVWQAGLRDGGMTFVMPWFCLDSCAVRNENRQGEHWNLDSFIQLADHSEGRDILYECQGCYKRLSLLDYVLRASLEDFYDWESGECRFSDKEFLALLECIKRADDGTGDIEDEDYIDLTERLKDGTILIHEGYFTSMPDFMNYEKIFGEAAAWVGYPNVEGGCHLFNGMMLGISKGSQNKEGAWAFLEYLLSAGIQDWTSDIFRFFPVRKEAFRQYLEATPWVNPADLSKEYPTEEQCRQLEEMVDNARLSSNQLYNPVYDIVWEECQAYFAGDKSAAETGEIINNRVKLYLNE